MLSLQAGKWTCVINWKIYFMTQFSTQRTRSSEFQHLPLWTNLFLWRWTKHPFSPLAEIPFSKNSRGRYHLSGNGETKTHLCLGWGTVHKACSRPGQCCRNNSTSSWSCWTTVLHHRSGCQHNSSCSTDSSSYLEERRKAGTGDAVGKSWQGDSNRDAQGRSLFWTILLTWLR